MSSRGAASRWPATSRSWSSRPASYMLDGELVILDEDGAEVFDALQNRIHPAESRILRLAEETPALFRAFDLFEQWGREPHGAAVRRASRRRWSS